MNIGDERRHVFDHHSIIAHMRSDNVGRQRNEQLRSVVFDLIQEVSPPNIMIEVLLYQQLGIRSIKAVNVAEKEFLTSSTPMPMAPLAQSWYEETLGTRM